MKTQQRTRSSQFEIELRNVRDEMFSRLRDAVLIMSADADESTDALDEFVALALPCIKKGSELLNLLSGLRDNRQRRYVGSKLLPALAKKRPEVLASIELQELWPILGHPFSIQKVLWDAEDALVCASGSGA